MPSSAPFDPSGSPRVASARPFAGVPAGEPRSRTVTLIGTVEAGVESGCVVLLDEAGRALAQLLGPARTAYPFGARVQVTGHFATDMRTTGQQGPPFRVDAVTAG